MTHVAQSADFGLSTVMQNVQQPDTPTSEQIAARLNAFRELRVLLDQGSSTSGRKDKPWREWIYEGHVR